jgi:DNA repair ATPase RecN
MSADQHPMIRELFSNLKTTLNERLDLITQIINTIEKPKIPLYDNEFVKRIERLEHQQPQSSSFMEERIAALEEQLASTCSELEEVKARLAAKPVAGVLHEPILPEEEASIIVEEEEAEEEAGLELEEFPYKGTVYYKDANNNVYSTDDDGDVITEPIARWTGTKLVRI